MSKRRNARFDPTLLPEFLTPVCQMQICSGARRHWTPRNRSQYEWRHYAMCSRSNGTVPMTDELKRQEEEKRDRAYDPAERWRQIQRMISWAEKNMKPEFR